jgi:hypothetical protein
MSPSNSSRHNSNNRRDSLEVPQMAFNWQGATAGLLGEFGNQTALWAKRQDEIEERKLAEQREIRREEAAFTRQKALAEMGWKREDERVEQGRVIEDDKYKKRTEAEQKEYERRQEQERIRRQEEREADAKQPKDRDFEFEFLKKNYGEDVARQIMYEKAVGGEKGKGGLSEEERLKANKELTDSYKEYELDYQAKKEKHESGWFSGEYPEKKKTRDEWVRENYPEEYAILNKQRSKGLIAPPKPGDPAKEGAKTEEKPDGKFPGYADQGKIFDYDALFTAQKEVESGDKDFNKGKVVESPKGAKYAAQVMDATAGDPGFGIKPADKTGTQEQVAAEYNRVGREYSQKLMEKYNGDAKLALAAYNWGPGNVDEWIKNGSDPKDMPKETRGYIDRVMGKYEAVAAKSEQPGTPPATPGKQETIDDPRLKAILARAEERRAKAQERGKATDAAPMEEPGPSLSPVPEMEYVEGEPDTRSIPERIGTGAGLLTSAAKQGAQKVGEGAIAFRDAGEQLGKLSWWEDQVARLSAVGKKTLQAIEEQALIDAADIEKLAREKNMTLEQFLEGFRKGYK